MHMHARGGTSTLQTLSPFPPSIPKRVGASYCKTAMIHVAAVGRLTGVQFSAKKNCCSCPKGAVKANGPKQIDSWAKMEFRTFWTARGELDGWVLNDHHSFRHGCENGTESTSHWRPRKRGLTTERVEVNKLLASPGPELMIFSREGMTSKCSPRSIGIPWTVTTMWD
jgi:hypothetical protein